jgi:hypothetical protein
VKEFLPAIRKNRAKYDGFRKKNWLRHTANIGLTRFPRVARSLLTKVDKYKRCHPTDLGRNGAVEVVVFCNLRIKKRTNE